MIEKQDLKSILKSINKKYEDTVVKIGVEEREKSSFLSLGTPGFDFCTYNRIPKGIWCELSGPESSGKTTGAFLIAANHIRQEKKKPEEERQHILFVDAEGTADPGWALTSTGYDMNDKDIQTIRVTPTGQSAEQIFDMVREIVVSGQIGLVIFDSLTAIAPQQTNTSTFEQKDMGGLAKPLGDFVKRMTGVFNKYKCTFIGINGLIQNISGYGQLDVTPGGTYFKRACSLRLRFKVGEFFDDNDNILKGKDAVSPAGHVIEMAVIKTKFCRWDRKLGRCHLNYKKGIDLLWDTIEVATKLGFIDNSVQGSYSILDPDTGEVISKIRGKANLKPYFEEHKDLWHKLYDKVYEKIEKTDDPNIISFEQMLGINVEERFNVDLAKEQG